MIISWINLIRFVRAILIAMGFLWIPIESYEGVSNTDVVLPYWGFLSVCLVLGLIYFLVDGLRFSGYLRTSVTIVSNSFDSTIIVRFGDIFKHEGWKAISVNDFFDSIVDDDLVSRTSLHGTVINTFWSGDSEAWQREVNSDLSEATFECVQRTKGNTRKFPVGTTVSSSSKAQKFLFVVLGQTNVDDNVASATTDDLARSVRGMLSKARTVCAGQPLIIPLMGSGLSRVGIRSAILIDIILAVLFQETKKAKITDSIVLVLPREKIGEINLGAVERDWK